MLLDFTCILYDLNDQCRLNGAVTFSTYLSLFNICKFSYCITCLAIIVFSHTFYSQAY